MSASLSAALIALAANLGPLDVDALAGDASTPTWLLWLGLAFATFASEDLACIGAGLLVAKGRIAFVPAALACTVGIWVGDVLLFLAGRGIDVHGGGAVHRWARRARGQDERGRYRREISSR